MATELYETIEYSPGWYYKRWPGFYNQKCYMILSDYSHHPEKYVQEEGVEECKDTDPAMEEETTAIVCLGDCTVDHVHNPNKKPKRKL